MTISIKTSQPRTHVLGAEHGTQVSFLLIAEESLTALEGTVTFPKGTKPRRSHIEALVAWDVADAEDEVKGANAEDIQAADFIPLAIKRYNPNPRMIATVADTFFARWEWAQKLTEDEHDELMNTIN